MRKVAKVILVNKRGKLVLQRRDNKMNIDQPGTLSLFGGSVETDESTFDAAVREINEELGIDLVPRFLRFVCEKTIDNGGEYIHVFYYVYDQKIDEQLLTVEEGEMELANWESLKVSRQLAPLFRVFVAESEKELFVISEQTDPIALP